MAKLSELIRKIDKTAKEGNRERALKMIDSLLEKVPGNKALEARKDKYLKELRIERRLVDLEEKYGVGSGS